MVKVSLNGNSICLRLPVMKGFHAIQPEYNCFILMIISVDTLGGFALEIVLFRLKLLEMARNAQWVHLFSMDFDDHLPYFLI